LVRGLYAASSSVGSRTKELPNASSDPHLEAA